NSIEILPVSYVRSCSFQQRLSYTTLSDLALRLIDGTHLNLYNQRQNLHCEHQGLSRGTDDG
uniref:Uncharacterized protein n=1 Tax=Oncorhynchus mykiss TaxID=8022 RepID=A0A8C7S705_ONCMY